MIKKTKDVQTQLSKKEKKSIFQAVREKKMNPLRSEDFDPKTFDPMADIEDADIKCRKRIQPPRRLPSMGMMPKEILVGQMIGMYESPQDLYLLIAWLSERVSDLEDALKKK